MPAKDAAKDARLFLFSLLPSNSIGQHRWKELPTRETLRAASHLDELAANRRVPSACYRLTNWQLLNWQRLKTLATGPERFPDTNFSDG